MTDLDDEPAPERATVVTLAHLAGVAPSTVSRALKGDPRISGKTRQRIAALATAQGYMPNVLARTLSSGRSGLVGLVLGSIENPFYADLMQQAVTQSIERGVRLLLLHAGSGPIEDRTAEALLQYKVDGCLISSAELSSHAAQICAAHSVPVVMVNRVPRVHASAVTCDNRHGAETLASLLLGAGHTSFAIVKGGAESSNSIERERSFAEYVADHGGEVVLRVAGGTTYEGGFAAGRMFAEMPAADRPHAVFAVADIMAMGVMDALRIAGIDVPGHISVTGFDGIAAAGWPVYGITTVAQPLQAMVSRGLDLLTARIGNANSPDEMVTLRGELILRRSARVAA
jgi:DNA-binding LacI/PurR family transcriptional regulator